MEYLLGQKTCVLSPPPLCIQVEFRKKYKIPLILDESVSFGVLGATGRGATEHFGLDVRLLVNKEECGREGDSGEERERANSLIRSCLSLSVALVSTS